MHWETHWNNIHRSNTRWGHFIRNTSRVDIWKGWLTVLAQICTPFCGFVHMIDCIRFYFPDIVPFLFFYPSDCRSRFSIYLNDWCYMFPILSIWSTVVFCFLSSDRLFFCDFYQSDRLLFSVFCPHERSLFSCSIHPTDRRRSQVPVHTTARAITSATISMTERTSVTAARASCSTTTDIPAIVSQLPVPTVWPLSPCLIFKTKVHLSVTQWPAMVEASYF